MAGTGKTAMNVEAIERSNRLVTLALAEDSQAMGMDLREASRQELVRTTLALALRVATLLEAIGQASGATGEMVWRRLLADPSWNWVPED